MDMNDVIISLGGVSQITAPLAITATDAEIESHLANSVIGDIVPTLAQVKAQIPVYQDMVSNPVVPVPSIVSMRQARLALLQTGLLSTVSAAIAAGGDADKIEWEYAADVDRNSPLVQSMKAGLNLTDADLDNLFTLASSL